MSQVNDRMMLNEYVKFKMQIYNLKKHICGFFQMRSSLVSLSSISDEFINTDVG